MIDSSGTAPNGSRYLASCYLFLCALLLWDRIAFLVRFSFRYLDKDQVLLWYGARDFLNGEFHEPAFYGQAYGTMIESLLAVPLLGMGASYPVALPLVTSLLGLLPFLLVSGLAWRSGRTAQACLVVGLPLLMPVEFGVLTSMPRNFVTGLALASIATVALFTSGNRWALTAAGFFCTMGLWANPNAAPLVLAIGMSLVLSHARRPRASLYLATGVAPAAAWVLLVRRFYAAHPEFAFHSLPPLRFSVARWVDGIAHIDRFLGDVTPVLWGSGWFLVLTLVALTGLLAWQRQTRPAVALGSAALLTVLALGLNKIHDGEATIFYSFSRMFLAVPVLMALFVSRIRLHEKAVRYTVAAVLVGCTLLSVVRYASLPARINDYTTTRGRVNAVSVQELRDDCLSIKDATERYGADLVVLGLLRDTNEHEINYGCHCLVDGFPPTYLPVFERRTWRIQEESHLIRETILFYRLLRPDDTPEPLQRIDSETLLLRENRLATNDLLSRMGIPIRNYLRYVREVLGPGIPN